MTVRAATPHRPTLHPGPSAPRSTGEVESPAAVQHRLTTMVVGGAGVHEILAELHRLVPRAMVIADKDGRVLASEESKLDSGADLHLVSSEHQQNGPVGPRSAPPGAPTNVVMDLQSASGALGTLTVSGDQLSAFEQEVIDFGLLAASLILAKETAVANTEERLRGHLIEELLIDHRASEDLVRRRAHAAGIPLESPCLVVVATPLPVRSSALRASAAALATDHASATGVIDGMLVCVWPGSDGIAAGRAIAAALRGADSVRPTVSVAGPTTGVTGLRKAYGQASASIPLIRALGREGTIVTPADLRPYTAIFRAADAGELRDFIEGALGKLIAYDECHRGGLLGTLEAYLDESGNMARTARALHTHVNTLYQRLARLDCVLGDDWRQPERRLELHLALRLMRLSDRLAQVDG